MKNIAILGATGYIGKTLTYEFISEDKDNLFLFSRSVDKLKVFKNNKNIKILNYKKFNSLNYDVIINCTGIGDPNILRKDLNAIFKTTEEMDNMVLSYLVKNKKSIYVNLSSGAAYGDSFNKKIDENSKATFNLNNFKVSEFYSIAKINSEAKHRPLKDFNIVDLRVFAFFSRFVDVEVGFLMSEIVSCLKNKKTFVTDDNNLKRDYITGKDLLNLIRLIIKKGRINDSFDVYSLSPVSKFELISFLKKKYDFKYEIIKGDKINKTKNFYFSNNKKAEKVLGYIPKFSSKTGIDSEIKYILG